MSYASVITRKGIEEAVQGLGYKSGSALKYRLVEAIRGLYREHGESMDAVRILSQEDLIRSLWEVDDDLDAVRNKKKNLSSLKSLVNADLKRLYQEGKNPQGIVIGPENVFTISDEAKDDLLANFRTGTEGDGTASMVQVKEVLERLTEVLARSEFSGAGRSAEAGSGLDQIRNLVKDLSNKVGLTGGSEEGAAQGGVEGATGTSDSETSENAASPETEGSGDAAEAVTALDVGEDIQEAELSVQEEPLEEEEVEEAEEADELMVEETSGAGDLPETSETEGAFEEALATIDESGDLIDALEPEELLEIGEGEAGQAEDWVVEEASVDGDLTEGAEGAESGGDVGDAPLGDDPGEIVEVLEAEEVEDQIEALDDLPLEEVSAEEDLSELPVMDEGVVDALEEDALEVQEVEGEEVDAGEVEETDDLVMEEALADSVADGEGGSGSEGDAVDGPGSGDEPGVGVDASAVGDDLPDTEVVEAEEVDEDLIEETEDLMADKASGGEDPEGLSAGAAADAAAQESTPIEEAIDVFEEDEDLNDTEEVEAEEVDEAQIEDGDDLILEEAPEEDVPSAGLAGAAEGSDGGAGTGAQGGMAVPSDGEYMPAAGASMEDLSWTEADEKKKARILAEKFSGSLSEMDRFFNRYIRIADGDYVIGSGNGGSTLRRVPITQFHMGKFPVTNGLFDVFVEKTGYVTMAEKVGYGTVYYGRLQKRMDEKTGGKSLLWSASLTSKIVPGAFWYRPFGPGSTLHHKRNHPVVQVSIEDCMAFAAWAGKRLPTEEEWEAASRTMKGQLYPWGNRFRRNACNFEKSAHGETTPVDLYLKHENEYGIADALGNVLEWTTTRLDRPEGESDRDTVYFITKGGCWITDKPVDLTGRTEMRSDAHSNILGFRCVAY